MLENVSGGNTIVTSLRDVGKDVKPWGEGEGKIPSTFPVKERFLSPLCANDPTLH